MSPWCLTNQKPRNPASLASVLLYSVEDALLTALPQETLHPLHAWWGGAAFAVPLELVDILAEHVTGAQGGDEVVKLSLVLPDLAQPAANS